MLLDCARFPTSFVLAFNHRPGVASCSFSGLIRLARRASDLISPRGLWDNLIPVVSFAPRASPSLGNRTITTVIAPTGFQRIRGVSIASEGRRVESSRVERNAWERIESNF